MVNMHGYHLLLCNLCILSSKHFSYKSICLLYPCKISLWKYTSTGGTLLPSLISAMHVTKLLFNFVFYISWNHSIQLKQGRPLCTSQTRVIFQYNLGKGNTSNTIWARGTFQYNLGKVDLLIQFGQGDLSIQSGQGVPLCKTQTRGGGGLLYTT